MAPAQATELIGECRFDRAALSFAGTSGEQAACLLRRVERGGLLRQQGLPGVLVDLLADDAPPPDALLLSAAIARFPQPYRSWALARALEPVSRTQDGLPALYFVIHDTSMPFLQDAPFPRRLDRDERVNNLAVYVREEPVAHVFLNRAGQIWPGHDLSRPWRATKLETRMVGIPARGRFIHVELVQPRRFAPGSTSRQGTLAPRPGFSKVQYRQLAALYVYASARAGRWLIPAFHAALDAGLHDAHDDPQNFKMENFAAELERLFNRQRRQ